MHTCTRICIYTCMHKSVSFKIIPYTHDVCRRKGKRREFRPTTPNMPARQAEEPTLGHGPCPSRRMYHQILPSMRGNCWWQQESQNELCQRDHRLPAPPVPFPCRRPAPNAGTLWRDKGREWKQRILSKNELGNTEITGFPIWLEELLLDRKPTRPMSMCCGNSE